MSSKTKQPIQDVYSKIIFAKGGTSRPKSSLKRTLPKGHVKSNVDQIVKTDQDYNMPLQPSIPLRLSKKNFQVIKI